MSIISKFKFINQKKVIDNKNIITIKDILKDWSKKFIDIKNRYKSDYQNTHKI